MGSVRNICLMALVLANFASAKDCKKVTHSSCTVCPAHWYVECPSGYVHKTYRSCGVFGWGCQLECVREWTQCCEDCNDRTCPLPRYYTLTSPPTKDPTPRPTRQPTNEPTPYPTSKPTTRPTPRPTKRPSKEPTRSPTIAPTNYPTESPTDSPTKSPTPAPTPSESPTLAPTFYFTTSAPTMEPTVLGPELVGAAISDKKTCKVTSGCYFGVKAKACSLFRGVCEEISNKRTCKNAEPCVIESGRCRSKPLSTLSPTSNPTLIPSATPTSSPTMVPSTSPTSVPSFSPSSVPSFSPSSDLDDCINTCAVKLNEVGMCLGSKSCRNVGADFCRLYGDDFARYVCEEYFDQWVSDHPGVLDLH